MQRLKAEHWLLMLFGILLFGCGGKEVNPVRSNNEDKKVVSKERPFTQNRTSNGVKVKAIYGFSRELEPFKGKSEAEIIEMLKNLGIRAVFGDYKDERFVKALHQAGINVYAEIGLFQGAKYWERHPESRPITKDGKPLKKIKWYAGVCPNQEWLRKEKLKKIKDLLKYNIDGIWLDFIRYPCHWEVPEPKFEETCFCPVCLERFQKETNISIPLKLKILKQKARWILEKKQAEWSKWKCKNITSFVKEIKESINKIRPETNPAPSGLSPQDALSRRGGVKLGLFGVPWQDEDYNNAIHRIIGQDYKELAKHIDIFSPMVYHKLCNKNISWIEDITNYIQRITKKDVWPIVLASDISSQELKEAISRALKAKSKGVILFGQNQLECLKQ